MSESKGDTKASVVVVGDGKTWNITFRSVGGCIGRIRFGSVDEADLLAPIALPRTSSPCFGHVVDVIADRVAKVGGFGVPLLNDYVYIVKNASIEASVTLHNTIECMSRFVQWLAEDAPETDSPWKTKTVVSKEDADKLYQEWHKDNIFLTFLQTLPGATKKNPTGRLGGEVPLSAPLVADCVLIAIGTTECTNSIGGAYTAWKKRAVQGDGKTCWPPAVNWGQDDLFNGCKLGSHDNSPEQLILMRFGPESKDIVAYNGPGLLHFLAAKTKTLGQDASIKDPVTQRPIPLNLLELAQYIRILQEMGGSTAERAKRQDGFGWMVVNLDADGVAVFRASMSE
jgi:hypothetical protein